MLGDDSTYYHSLAQQISLKLNDKVPPFFFVTPLKSPIYPPVVTPIWPPFATIKAYCIRPQNSLAKFTFKFV